MKHGCMVMKLRLSSSRRSGSCQIHRSQKKCVKFAAMSIPCCSFFFLTSKALTTRNSYPLVKLSTASFTRFWSGWGRAFGTNVLTSGRKTIGFSTVTTLPLTHHRCSTIPDFQKHYSDSPPHLFVWPRPLWLFPIPYDEITAERALFWHDWGDPCRNAGGNRHAHIWELPGMHEIMGNMLGLLCICPKGQLWRRWWKLGVTVRNFFMVKFPEFLGSPTYNTIFLLLPSIARKISPTKLLVLIPGTISNKSLSFRDDMLTNTSTPSWCLLSVSVIKYLSFNTASVLNRKTNMLFFHSS